MTASSRKPTTVYLLPAIARAAKLKAALSGRSLSDLANEALSRILAEDERDIRLLRERRDEPSRPYESVLRDLKRDGLL